MTTLQHAIQARGLDEIREIYKLKRRLRHQLDPHGHYYFATTKVKHLAFWQAPTESLIDSLRVAVELNSTVLYVSAWTQANHLVGEMP
jgi:hypothetical protein